MKYLYEHGGTNHAVYYVCIYIYIKTNHALYWRLISLYDFCSFQCSRTSSAKSFGLACAWWYHNEFDYVNEIRNHKGASSFSMF
jgi:glyceraldehyde-3-phosphate dehydrogenase/erythrose-4-phosphate dehydrogenase